jgi:two-component system, NarL family, invasion response regulator UvrY
MPKILIADDHVIVRKGLLFLCKTSFGFEDVDEVTNGNELMMALKRQQYTHLILDLILTDGATLEIAPAIAQLYPELHILIFTAQSLDLYRVALNSYGITRFISKEAPERDTIMALKAFLNNAVNDHTLGVAFSPDNDNTEHRFSPRELEVLQYLITGMRNAEIAQKLCVAENTIATVKRRILDKTGTDNVIALKEWLAVYQHRRDQ